MKALLGLMLSAMAAPLTAQSAAVVSSTGGFSSATIGFGGSVNLNGIRITPVGVTEDSRCPADVQCIWAGRLTVAVSLTYPGGGPARVQRISLGETLSLPAGQLTLASAEPAKLARSPIAERDYQFTFTLRR